jgi:hypothetical protein
MEKFILKFKKVYRADFRQTLVELTNQANGEYKFTLGAVLAIVGGTLWLYVLVRKMS